MEQLFAFVLGVGIMSLIYGLVLVLRMRKELNNVESNLHNTKDEVMSINREIERIDKRIDSRVDKLTDIIFRELENKEKDLQDSMTRNYEQTNRDFESVWREIDKQQQNKNKTRKVLTD